MFGEPKSLKPAISASLLAGILESATDAIITVNEQQNIVLFNRAAEAMFGWPAESALQQPLEWLIPSRFRSAHARQLGQFGITGTTSRRMGQATVLHGLRANGEEFPIDVSISHIDTPAGKLFTAIVRDISDAERHKRVELESYARLALSAAENTRLLQEVSQLNAGLERKVAERTVALARQEALFHALAEQAPQVVWTADPKGAVTYFNQAWFNLVGGKLDDWTGAQWLSVLHPDDAADVKTNWLLSRASQSPFLGIRRWRAQGGSWHTMAYRASPVLDEQGAVAFWVGIDADISEVKAIETALRLSNKELEAFSYSVSHDLRTPLSTIDGFSRLLTKQLAGEADAKVPYYLARIQAGVAQMGQLIEDLLSLAQVVRAPLRSEPVDLSLMARSVLDEWQVRQPARKVNVQIQGGLQAHGDGRLLRVVMDNLLGNAWKFSAQQPQAEISMGQQADAAGEPVFFVRDNGAGFDMACADKLFTPFQRLHAVSEFAGTGIGLATVSRVIGRHGGRLWAEAAPGRGATFFFTLPRQAVTV